MQAVRIPLYALLSAIGYAFVDAEMVAPLGGQAVLTLLFMLVVGFEKWHARRPFFVLPPSVFSIYCFVNIFVSGLIYFALHLQDASQIVVRDQTVLRGAWYTLVAVQVLWIGFHMLPDARVSIFGDCEVRRVPKSVIVILTAVAVVSFAVGVNSGMYGYAADDEQVDWLSYIRFGVNLGLLAIVLLVAYEYETLKSKSILWGLVALNIVIGLAFGSKSTAVLPVLLVIVTLYFTGRKIARSYWVAVGLTILVSYMVVEPFRFYYDVSGRSMDLSSLQELASAYTSAVKASEGQESDYLGAIIERGSYVLVLGKTIEFADRTNYYQDDEWRNLALSPLYAVVPRFIWQSKPLANFGIWASVNIFGFPETTHTGITPQGYAYLVLRLAGVLIFFTIAGLLQRFVFNLLYLNTGFIPFYILLYLEVGHPAVVPWTYLGGTIKSLVFFAPLMAGMVYLNRVRK